MSVCAVTRVVFRRENAWPTALPGAFVWREVASPTAFENKTKQKNNNFEDKIQNQFLYVTNRRRKSKATSGGRNKSTGTSSESFYSDPAPRNVGFFLLK